MKVSRALLCEAFLTGCLSMVFRKRMEIPLGEKNDASFYHWIEITYRNVKKGVTLYKIVNFCKLE